VVRDKYIFEGPAAVTKSVLAMVQKCGKCKASFIPQAGEICKCPAPMYEDHPFQPQPLYDYPTEEDKAIDA
jgi:hypothetical protein